MIRFFARGIPAAQGSKVYLAKGQAKESNPHLKSWRSVVAAAWPEGEPMLEGPIKLDALFLYPRPKTHYGRKGGAPYLKSTAPAWKTSAPDADKLLRSILDSLTGIAYSDDAQVAQVSGAKGFTEERAGVLITVTSLAIDWPLPCLNTPVPQERSGRTDQLSFDAPSATAPTPGPDAPSPPSRVAS